MKLFRDSLGRQWSLTINTSFAKQLRDLAKFDLAKLGPKELAELVADPVLLGDVLYVLVRSQCEEKKVSDVAFAQGLGGDSIDAALEALVPELIDFFPKRRRELLAAVWTKSQSLESAGLAAALDKLQDPEIDQIMANVMAGLSGKSSTGSPASPASTPDPSPSGS